MDGNVVVVTTLIELSKLVDGGSDHHHNDKLDRATAGREVIHAETSTMLVTMPIESMDYADNLPGSAAPTRTYLSRTTTVTLKSQVDI